MSLHKFAEQVAAQGRGDDSLLIHMTPDEVNRLQAFAQANGRSLTINPHTGLPEAGMLSDLFKAVAPIALGAFLGPAGAAFGGGLMSAGMAGLTVGGLTTLATGSLSRGLMAGLGAYGGAGLASGLETAGAGALEANAAAAAQGQLGAANLALGEALPEQAAKQFTQDAAARQVAAATPMDKFGAGLGAITSSPEAAGAFAKDNWKSLAAAAAPIMAGSMVPTTTKMPENTNPAYIRQKLYDPYTQTYKSLTPVKASEWGGRSFSDAYTNPQTGEMATLQPRTPGMAGGGIVALAGGGVSDTDIFNYFKTPGLTDTQIAADMQKYGVSAADIARATGTQGQQADYEKRFVQAVSTPGTSAEEFQTAASTVGLQNQALADAMRNAGMSQAAQYALTHADNDAGFTKGIIDANTGKPVDFYTDIGYTAGALPGDQGGLEGLHSNINYAASGLQNLINSGKMTVAQAQDAALAEMQRSGTSLADVKAATGKSFGDLFTPKKEEKKTTTTTTTDTGVVPGGTQLPGATAYDNGAFGNYGSGPATGVDYLGRTVSIATPGDIITNPDQTRTVVPNIPGRPYGGFTGMDQVKSRYTAGGGSLGYTSPVPRTMAEFDQLYNKQTGDSLAAYNYLMGKGANNNAYPVQSQAAATTTGIQRPYWSAGVKYKPRYLSYDKEGNIVSADTKGGTAGTGTTTGSLTAAKTINVVNNRGESETATLSSDGNYYTSGGDAYDVTGKPVQAKAEGGMTYAMGGGLGSLGSYSDGGRLLKGPGDGVSDSIPATIGAKQQPARLADGEFVVPARIVSELGNGSTEAGAKKLYAMMDRVQKARGKTTGKNKVAANSRADKYLPA